MLEQSHFYPVHIKDLISDLEHQDFGDSVLMKYHCKTISDRVLSRVYSSFNYPDLQNVPSKLIIETLMKEYMLDFPPIDADTECFKAGYSQTFYDNQISFLTDPSDFGLEFQKQENL